MIKTWRLSHFKSVYDETALTLAPLTIFAGANSSGKSTIIQSILLTAQTLQSSVVGRPVVLNGHMARLGGFPDIVSGANEQDSVTVGFELEPHPSDYDGKPEYSVPKRTPGYSAVSYLEFSGTLDCSYKFGIRDARVEPEVARLQPVLEEVRLKVTAPPDPDDHEGRFSSDEIVVRRATRSPADRAESVGLDPKSLPAPVLSSLAYEIARAPSTILRRRGLPVPDERATGARLIHFLPRSLAIVYDAVEAEVTRVLELLTAPRVTAVAARQYTRTGEPINDEVWRITIEALAPLLGASEDLPHTARSRWDHFFAAPTAEKFLQLYRTLPAPTTAAYTQRMGERLDDLRVAIRAGRSRQNEVQLQGLPEPLDSGVDVIQAFFTSALKYLGPLRDEPKPVYPLAGATDPGDVGFRGEHTAAVLDVHRRTEVQYIPAEVYAKPGTERRIRTATLFEAVLDWLTYMGVGSKIRTHDRGKLGHELKIATADSQLLQDLTQVGVGVSQVLPILVLSLLAESGSTLIFEQPELHLHPRVQTRLADFFVSMTGLGIQCIVETHSEYLINRLRYQAALSQGRDVSDAVVMYFVEKEEGRSRYRAVRINEFGVIEDWPRGFFDENEENAALVLRAGLEKRKRQSEDPSATRRP